MTHTLAKGEPLIPLSELRVIWLRAKTFWEWNDIGTDHVFRALVQDELSRRAIEAQALCIADLALANTQLGEALQVVVMQRDAARARNTELEAQLAQAVAAPTVTLSDEVIHAMRVFAYPGADAYQLDDLWIAAKILRVFLSTMKGGSE